MILRDGPELKPAPEPPGFAKAHPIRNVLTTIGALLWAALILFAALSVLLLVVM